MGVPKFFRALVRRYPDIILSAAVPPDTSIDWLHLDFNGLMHPVCRGIMKQFPLLPAVELEERMLSALCREVDRMIDRFAPRAGILVAIDGPAPVAKMVQQRERRFKTMVDGRDVAAKRAELGLPPACAWDTNAMTPGTAFLTQVGERVGEHLRKLANPPVRILSDGQVPGEGEHKLFEYIRKNALVEETHVIVGLDADLIFLSSLSPAHRIFLAREEEPEVWRSVNVQRFREVLCEDVEVPWMDPRRPQVLQDLCMLACMFGNDFLPTIYVFDLRYQGLLRLLEGYRTYWRTHQQTLVDAEGQLHLDGLAEILRPFAQDEATLLADEVGHITRRRPPPFSASQEASSQENAFAAWEHRRLWPALDPAVHRIPWNSQGWQDEYYRDLFELAGADGTPSGTDEVGRVRRSAAAHYVEGIQWVLDYYTGRLKDWQWSYPFHTAPLIQDVVTALGGLGASAWHPEFPSRGPLLPLHQLALVLPVGSHVDLLPATLNTLLRENFWWFYPVQTHRRGFLRTQAWEFLPLLPPWPRDLAEIFQWMSTAALAPEVRVRNAHLAPRVFGASS